MADAGGVCPAILQLGYEEAEAKMTDIPKDFVYQPIPGFFDISKKPSTLTAKTHRKLQWGQTELSTVGPWSKWKHMESEWMKWGEWAAQLQQILLQHWTLEELGGGDKGELAPEQYS